MPNNDYILRSDAVFAVQKRIEQIGMGNNPYVCSIRQGVRDVPAADVELKRYAEWVSPDGISVCSKCGKAAPYDVEGDMIMYWPNLNFCPNCGCRMNVEGKDAEVH